MKNKILLIIICLMIFPFVVEAKEYCEVVKGDANKPGAELKCGTESFYLVSSSESSVQLLAKYNLLVGDKIDVIDINYSDFEDSGASEEEYCMQVGSSAGYHPYYAAMMYEYNNFEIDYSGDTKCRIYEKINYNRVRQDERAVGTKLVNGKSVLPLYGIVYMNPYWGYEYIHDDERYDFEYDNRGNLKIETTPFEKYLDGYKDELNTQGIEASKVSFITFNRTLSLLEEVYGHHIDVDLEYDNNPNDPVGHYTGKMDITRYANNNEWIYGTTYWLGSGFYEDSHNQHQDYENDYYISNEGMLCAIGRGECIYLPYPIGNGIRPLVTITKNDIKYKINTKTDGNGTIEVVNTASGNETIQFRVTANAGYKLGSLIVTTDSGETVEFDEGSIITNPDGTISIDKNAFKMPFENVTIEAKWVKNSKDIVVNPKTARQLWFFVK